MSSASFVSACLSNILDFKVKRLYLICQNGRVKLKINQAHHKHQNFGLKNAFQKCLKNQFSCRLPAWNIDTGPHFQCKSSIFPRKIKSSGKACIFFLSLDQQHNFVINQGVKALLNQCFEDFYYECNSKLLMRSTHRIIETQKRKVVSVGKDLKDHLVPMPLPWVGTPSTRSGCQQPHPTWPWLHVILCVRLHSCHMS